MNTPPKPTPNQLNIINTIFHVLKVHFNIILLSTTCLRKNVTGDSHVYWFVTKRSPVQISACQLYSINERFFFVSLRYSMQMPRYWLEVCNYPLLSASFPIHGSLIILPFDTIQRGTEATEHSPLVCRDFCNALYSLSSWQRLWFPMCNCNFFLDTDLRQIELCKRQYSGHWNLDT